MVQTSGRIIDIFKSNRNYFINSAQINIQFDASVIIDELGFSGKDLLREGGELALALTGFLFGPIAGLIGLGGYGVAKLIKGLFGKDEAKDKAKNEAKQQINEAKGQAK